MQKILYIVIVQWNRYSYCSSKKFSLALFIKRKREEAKTTISTHSLYKKRNGKKKKAKRSLSWIHPHLTVEATV
jgi:hypothetical protein